MNEQLLKSIIDHSFKDFHVKGFDYICLRRQPELTEKFYFFSGDVRHLPEVVAPHNHRYDFCTDVITGGVTNYLFVDDEEAGATYNEFDYMTPLNGGSGFTWRGERKLRQTSTRVYWPKQGYVLSADQLHTIRIITDGTVLRLRQFEDVVPLTEPTQMFTMADKAPRLSGLYSKFTADEVLKKLRLLSALGVRLRAESSTTQDVPAH